VATPFHGKPTWLRLAAARVGAVAATMARAAATEIRVRITAPFSEEFSVPPNVEAGAEDVLRSR
jgi:hypothetical protein